MMHDPLEELAEMLEQRAKIDARITTLIGRPALSGNIGEFVAAHVFDIELVKSGSHPGHDGHFRSGPRAGRSVNVKLYSQQQNLLDISPHPCDDYLVLMGAGSTGAKRVLPWKIAAVYLFDHQALLAELERRGVKIGVATSIRREQWEQARIFPHQAGSRLPLTPEQTARLSLFT